MDSWNGLSLLRSESWSSSANHCIQTDASGSWGCGAFFSKGTGSNGNGLMNGMHNASIMAKELRSTDSLEMWCMGS